MLCKLRGIFGMIKMHVREHDQLKIVFAALGENGVVTFAARRVDQNGFSAVCHEVAVICLAFDPMYFIHGEIIAFEGGDLILSKTKMA